MGCLFAILAVSFPRLALFFIWLFTPLVYRAFDTFIVPLLGIIFLPFTTLMYVLAYISGFGLSGWGWFWVILGVFVDMVVYVMSEASNCWILLGLRSIY